MKIITRLLLTIVLLAILAGGLTQYTEAQNRPNVILIMADDMGYECLSANGSLSYQTPNLDELADKGVRFTQCISQPLCTPSRVKIMTGKYNYQNYVDFEYLDVNEKTFGHLMQKAGYKTAIAGKWQLNGIGTQHAGWEDVNRPYHFGFDEYCLWQLTKTKQEGERFANPLIQQNGEMLTGLEDKYGPDIFADFVIDFIERNKQEKFFVYYPMVLVHNPFVPTPDSPEWQDKTRRNEKDNRYFKDMVVYTDKVIGRIVNKLKAEGLMENTIVIFTGDNGTKSSIYTETSDGLIQGGKGQMNDRGTRVPLVAAWGDKLEQGQVYNYLVEFSDFLPTVVEAANGSIPGDCVGHSFLNVLQGKAHQPRETVMVHYDHKREQGSKKHLGRFVRTLDYKLYHDGRFYNLKTDKGEEHPLEDIQLTEDERLIKKHLEEHQQQAPAWHL